MMRIDLSQISQRYATLKPRERVLVLSALLAVIFTLWSAVAYQPLQTRYAQGRTDLSNLRANMETLRTQQAVYMQQQNQDPNAEIKGRLARINEEISKLDGQLQQKLRGLIAPQQMAAMLEGILQQHAQLQLQRIQNTGATPLLEPESDDENESEKKHTVEIYRHGVEIEFTGSYLATLAYLQALKSLPWEFYWDALQYDVEKYPLARVIITVHTLSLQEGWIGV